ncbi:MAG: hypothetical protein N2645_10285 [Clostridia bacterium]|nr:hypothetical protein [Clostridia bacterium]
MNGKTLLITIILGAFFSGSVFLMADQPQNDAKSRKNVQTLASRKNEIHNSKNETKAVDDWTRPFPSHTKGVDLGIDNRSEGISSPTPNPINVKDAIKGNLQNEKKRASQALKTKTGNEPIPANQPKTSKLQSKGEQIQKGSALNTLEDFYSKIESSEYHKAYELLDEDFKSHAFRLLGFQGSGKRDIDLNKISEYKSIIKTIKLKKVVEIRQKNNEATICFYHTFLFQNGSEFDQPLIACLKKRGEGWKVVSLSDGNVDQSPFKELKGSL